MNALSAGPEYLSWSEAARFSGLSISTLRRLLRCGKLRLFRPSPGRVLLARRDLIGVIEGDGDGSAAPENPA